MSSSLLDSSVKEQSAISSKDQIATLPEQSVAISNPNGKVNEYNNKQSNQRKDQIENISQISTFISNMGQFVSKFRSTKEQLKNILSLIPNKSCETNSDKDDVNTAYLGFRQSISQMGIAYSELVSIYNQFQQQFNQVKNDLCIIYKQVYQKIKSNQVLSRTFLDSQKNKISKAETQISDLIDIQQKFRESLKIKCFEQKIDMMLTAINKAEQINLNKEEVEKKTAELRRRDKELNDQKSKLELILIEMNFSNLQEERLKQDYQSITDQLNQIEIQNYLQQNNLDKIETDKGKLIVLLQQQMSKNKIAKEKMSKQIIQDHFNRNKLIGKMFSNTLQQISDLQITQSSRGFIIVLDESGSMSGQPFQNCVLAIKEQVRYLKSNFPNDEFCMIQFGSKARITINLSAVQYVKESDIGKTFNGGGTDFFEAFSKAKEAIQLFDCKVINIMFVTDGGDSNTSKYLNVLRQIKAEKPNNKFQMFGMAFGSQVSSSNIRDCLNEINGSPLTITANSKKIQSYFEVNVAEDLINSFKRMFEAQSESIEEFNAKDNKRRELIEQQQIDADKMRESLLSQFDQEYGMLQNQLNQEQQDNAASQKKGKEVLQSIFDSQKMSLQKQLEAREKELKDLNFEKKVYQEKIKDVENVIKYLESERDNFCKIAGSAVDNQKIQENVIEYEEEIKQLGFTGKTHYDKLQQHLKTIDSIQISLYNFSDQITGSLNHLNQIRESINEGIEQFSEQNETNEDDLESQLRELAQSNMRYIDPNYSNAEWPITKIIEHLIMVTSTEEYTRIKEDKELNYPLVSLCSLLKLSVIFKLQNGQKKSTLPNITNLLTIDQYQINIFKELFPFKDTSIQNAEMFKTQEKFEKLNEKIAEEQKKTEPRDFMIIMYQDQQVQLEEQLRYYQEQMQLQKQQNEERFQKFIDDHRRQYDFTRNIIRNIHLAIQMIEYKQRQSNIFMPLEMQSYALDILNHQSDELNTLAIL